MKILLLVLLVFGLSLNTPVVLAEQLKPEVAPPDGNTMDVNTPDGNRIDVNAIKEKYWARGNEAELGVVQDRLYSKAGKFKLGVFGGLVVTDPFLNVNNVGGMAGYYFNEYLSLNVLGWKNYTGPSSALLAFEQYTGGETNYNKPISFIGAELESSLLYGKLSVIGKAIIYFDLHLSLGAGSTDTASGSYVTPFVGLGQQVFISQHVSMSLNYHLMGYRETILEQVIPTKIGQPLGQRNNFTNAVTLGLDFTFGFFSKDKTLNKDGEKVEY